MKKSIEIDGRRIGPGQPPYVIAEMSANHLGDFDRAIQLIVLAKEAGADAIKLQTYTPYSLAIPTDDPDFQFRKGEWAGRDLFDLYKEAQTPYDWFPALFDKGRELGITVFSSPFDNEAVDLLQGLEAPAYKIASAELTDWSLVERVVATGKPVILSTGTATLAEIEDTVTFIEGCGGTDIALLHCISAYPAPVTGAHLSVIPDLKRKFGVPVGLSDHTLGTHCAVGAVALGAEIIEKHFTIARADGGPDRSFSAEPEELAELCQFCSEIQEAVGKAEYGYRSAEDISPLRKRHFYSVENIRAGETLSEHNIRSIRARKGIAAREFRDVFGKKAAVDIPKYSPITRDALR